MQRQPCGFSVRLFPAERKAEGGRLKPWERKPVETGCGENRKWDGIVGGFAAEPVIQAVKHEFAKGRFVQGDRFLKVGSELRQRCVFGCGLENLLDQSLSCA